MPLFHAHNQPPATALLLDTYPGATLAYGLRKLSNSYGGNAIRIRRSSDNTEQNIGFSGNDLDTNSLKSFITTSDAYIVTWYDQSGNTNNLTQATSSLQPRIALAGVIERDGGFPAVFTDGSDDYLQSVNNASIGTTSSVFVAANLIRNHSNYSRLLTWFNDQYMYVGTNTSEEIATFYGNGTWGTVTAQTSTTWLNTRRLVTTINDGNDNQFVNGSSTSTRSNPMGSVNFTLRFGGFYLSATDQMWQGYTQEIIIYSGVKTSDRTGIETNINNYYSIY